VSLSSEVYAFVFRGLLAEEALDKTERLTHIGLTSNVDAEIAQRLPLGSLDENLVSSARKMATVYISIAAFENTVREFVSKRLLELVGADWWTTAVSEKIREKAESRRQEETKIRWHTPRGDELINYTEFGDLASIMGQNWPRFEDHLQSLEWVRQIISTVERSRNVIMHSGDLGLQDIERIGTAIRDWIRQVGA
jgi:HEPN superfamily Swt1-like protein